MRIDVWNELGIGILFSLGAIRARGRTIAAARSDRIDWPEPDVLSAATADLLSRAAADELLEVAIVASIRENTHRL